jgi:LacI family transcriptional regulator
MERRRNRYGLEDVALRAGVGIATVDRVLNERGSVSPKTERRVLDAARELGLRRILPAPHARALRIEVMLARSATPFMHRLSAAMGQVAATLDRSITVIRSSIDMSDPARVAQRIAHCRADGIIVYCEEHPENIAAIAAAEAAGRPVICVVTDVPDSPRAAYVGIDHTKAGGTAAFFVAGMANRAGTAAILDPERAYHHVMQALRERTDLVAIYNTGGGSAGVGQALRDWAPRDPVIFVGHELTEESAVLLRDGLMTVTIDQAPELQARRSIDLMLSRLGSGAGQPIGGEIAFTLHTMENC